MNYKMKNNQQPDLKRIYQSLGGGEYTRKSNKVSEVVSTNEYPPADIKHTEVIRKTKVGK